MQTRAESGTPENDARPEIQRSGTMSDEVAVRLDYKSKLYRNPKFIQDLIAHGRERGRQFLDHLESPDADQKTALRNRNIWGQWIAPVPPYSGERSTEFHATAVSRVQSSKPQAGH